MRKESGLDIYVLVSRSDVLFMILEFSGKNVINISLYMFFFREN